MNDTDRTHASSRLISANSACIYDACIQSEKLMRWIAPAGAVANVEKFEAQEGGCFKIILSFNNDIGNRRRGRTSYQGGSSGLCRMEALFKLSILCPTDLNLRAL
jgi:hypothetical protein